VTVSEREGESEEDMKQRKTIRVPEWKEPLLKIGSDATHLGEFGYLIAQIGKPFIDANDRRMIKVTLVELPTPRES
jgi:hypothetical protein